MQILSNIDKFPIDLDDTLQQYYEKIVEKLEKVRYQRAYEIYSERFYVLKEQQPVLVAGLPDFQVSIRAWEK